MPFLSFNGWLTTDEAVACGSIHAFHAGVALVDAGSNEAGAEAAELAGLCSVWLLVKGRRRSLGRQNEEGTADLAEGHHHFKTVSTCLNQRLSNMESSQPIEAPVCS